MNAKIWIEVICEHCGGVVGYFYQNAKTIKRIKEETKDWRNIDGFNICGDCMKKINLKPAMKNAAADAAQQCLKELA